MRAQDLLIIFLLIAALAGCGGSQSLPLPGLGGGDGRPGRADVTVKDPEGPIPAPNLPPDMATAGTAVSAAAAGGQQEGGVPYTVVCRVRGGTGEEYGTDDEQKANNREKQEKADRIINTFKSTSLLYQLQDKPPESVTGLEQRLSVALGEAKEVMNSLGYYSGQARGRVKRPEKDPSGKGRAEVRVIFIPGEQYVMGKTTVTASVPGEVPEGARPLPASLEDVGLAQGTPAEAATVLAAVDRVREDFRNNGYPYVIVAQTRYLVDHENRTLEAEILVLPGAFVRMGDIERHGAPSVDGSFIANMRRWRVGRPWNQSRVESYQEALRQSGLFQSIVVEPGDSVDEHGNRAVVTKLESAPERTVGGAFKYHSDFGPGIQAFWEHRNLTGNGDRLRIEMPLWLDMQEVAANYRRPFFLRRDQDFIANGGFLNQDTDAYAMTAASVAAGIERRFNRNWSGSVKGSAEGGTIKEPEKKRRDYTMYGIPLGLTYDNTRSLLDATKGQRLMLSLIPYTGEYEGDFNILRSRVDAQAFVPLADEDKFVLAVRGTVGTVYGADSYEIPPSARFYSGGGGSVRGYEYQSLGPRNSDKDPLGGNALFETSVEGRYKFTKEWGMVAFVDGGAAFDSAPGQSTEFFNEDLRWGAGLGLRYYTAIGPVRLDIATPLNPRDDDDPLQFYISIGQSF